MSAWLPLSVTLPSLVTQEVCRLTGWTLALALGFALLLPVRWGRLRWQLSMLLGLALHLPFFSVIYSSLALSFQTPSLWAQVLMAMGLLQGWRKPATTWSGLAQCGPGWWMVALVGSLLMLDTAALTSVFLYPLGFGPWVAASALLLASLCRWWPQEPHAAWALRTWSLALALAMGLFVLSNGPSGNAWDAVLDPWFWLVSVAVCGTRVWRLLRRRW